MRTVSHCEHIQMVTFPTYVSCMGWCQRNWWKTGFVYEAILWRNQGLVTTGSMVYEAALWKMCMKHCYEKNHRSVKN